MTLMEKDCREMWQSFFLYPSFGLFVVLVSYGGEVGFGAVGYVDLAALFFYFVNGELVVVLDEPVVVVGPGFEGLFHGLVLGCGFDRLNHRSVGLNHRRFGLRFKAF